MAEGAASDFDEAAELIRRRAAFIGQLPGEAPYVSFTSLFLAFFACDDEVSRWVQSVSVELQLDLKRVFARWKQVGGPPDAQLDVIAKAQALELDGLPTDYGTSPSAGTVFSEAHESVTPRELLAAFLNHQGHSDDLVAWGIHRGRWQALFARRFAAEVPRQRPAGVHLAPALKRAGELANGPSITTDDLFLAIVRDGMANPSAEASTSAWLARTLAKVAEPWITNLPKKSGAVRELDPELQRTMTLAFAFSTATDQTTINVSDMLAAMFSDRRLTAIRARLAQAGTSAQSLLQGLLGWVHQNRWADIETWRDIIAADRVPVVRPLSRVASIHNDEAHGRDLLEVSAEVRPLAAVLASDDLKAPVSVGLFGDWGSGKSFFMHQLEETIKRFADESRKAKARKVGSAFASDVVQIRFNAWQYMDANPWASIVVHVFDKLEKWFADEKKTADHFMRELDIVKEQRATLEKESALLFKQAETIDHRILNLKAEREQRKLTSDDVIASLLAKGEQEVRAGLDKAGAKLGFDEGKLTLEQGRLLLAESGQIGTRLSLWWKSLRAGGWKLALVTGSLLLVVGPVAIAFIAERLNPGVEKSIVGAFSLLGGLVVSARGAIGKAKGPLDVIDKAIQDANAREKEVRAQVSEEERRQLRAQEDLAAEQSRIETARAGLVEREAAIQRELAAFADSRNVKKFIAERAASDDYRKQLGTISAVHRDFKLLSELLHDEKTLPHLDRIILYIDDLDRCPPERVVEMLQAIHLLLSLELFVVVVAIDSRWLLQSLRSYYTKHFGDSEEQWQADPQLYLEKIFQIPYAVPPMNHSGYSDFVGGLLRNQVSPRAAPMFEPAAPTEAKGDAPKVSALPAPPPPIPRAESPVNLNPQSLLLEQTELDHLKTLGHIIASPRSAKRVVNLYRIARAGLGDDELAGFVGGRYRLWQVFLAAVVGQAKESADLFKAIFEGKVTGRASLEAFLSEHAAMPKASPGWSALAKLFHQRDLENWEEVRTAIHVAARFSFQTGSVLRAAQRETI